MNNVLPNILTDMRVPSVLCIIEYPSAHRSWEPVLSLPEQRKVQRKYFRVRIPARTVSSGK